MTRLEAFYLIGHRGDGGVCGTVDGWSVATDRRAFVSVHDAELSPHAVPLPPGVQKFARELIARTPQGSAIDVPSLLAWCTPEACDECDGTGTVSCECDCCGEHEAACECGLASAGFVLGRLLDRNLVRDVLSVVPGASLALAEWIDWGSIPTLTLYGPDWRGVIAAMKEGEGDHARYPAFPGPIEEQLSAAAGTA